MKEFNLIRSYWNDKQVEGRLFIGADFVLTLELPWRDNKRGISCIPAGRYTVVRRTSPKYGEHFHITNVPNRDLILIHSGNYAGSKNKLTGRSDIKGCVLVGAKMADINGDGILDITNSKKSMKKLLKLLPKEPFILNVKGQP